MLNIIRFFLMILAFIVASAFVALFTAPAIALLLWAIFSICSVFGFVFPAVTFKLVMTIWSIFYIIGLATGFIYFSFQSDF